VNYDDLSVAAVVAVLALVPVVAGPLFPVGDLTQSRSPTLGTGDAEVTVERPPTEGIGLVRGRFGAGTYHLEARPGRVSVGDVTGSPALQLTVDLPALGYSDVRTYELAGREGETVRPRFRPLDVSPARVDGERIEGTVAVWLRTDDRYEQVYRESVRVEVRE
jgi:hypothetical protein